MERVKKKHSLAVCSPMLHEQTTNRSIAISDMMHSGFYESVAEILRAARKNAYRAVNFTMVEAYWNVGRRIVEEEQQGKERAANSRRSAWRIGLALKDVLTAW